MIRRMHFWKKRLLLPLAALPVFQLAGGCDTLLAGFASQLAGSTFNTFVGSIHQVLLRVSLRPTSCRSCWLRIQDSSSLGDSSRGPCDDASRRLACLNCPNLRDAK